MIMTWAVSDGSSKKEQYYDHILTETGREES